MAVYGMNATTYFKLREQIFALFLENKLCMDDCKQVLDSLWKDLYSNQVISGKIKSFY